jgi:hypothetical protein
MTLPMVTLTGHYQTANGSPETGTVTITPSTTLQSSSNNLIIQSGPVTATLDGTGSFSLSLVATDASAVSPTGWTYTVVERLGSQLAPVGRTYSILLPQADSPVDLSSISPVSPAGSLSEFGALGGNNTWSGSNVFTEPVSLDGQKITSLANGSGAQDAAAFNQIPVTGQSGDITIVGSTTSTGSTGRYADAGHGHSQEGHLAGDNNMLWESFPPLLASASPVLASSSTGGKLLLQRMVLRKTITMTNISFGVAVLDNGAITGSYLGVFDNTGTLKCVTADISSVFTTATVKTIAFTSPFTNAPPGEYFIGLLMNGTYTVLALKSSGGGVTANAGLAAPHLTLSNYGSGQSTMPTPITLSNQATNLITGGVGSTWYGIS